MSGTPPGDAAALSCLEALRLPRAADTLGELFRARAAIAPDSPFLAAGEGLWTWGEVDRASDRWAERLDGIGGPGDRVVLLMPNGAATVTVLLACAKAGRVCCPVDPELDAGALRAVLSILRPAAVFVAGGARAAAQAAPRLVGCGARICVVPDGALSPDEEAWPSPEPSAAPAAAPAAVPCPDDPLAIVFTSGTTGVPKGAVHTQRTYVTAAEIAAWRMRLGPADTVLVILPLFHLNALFYSVGGAIAVGARLVVEERFSASGFWRTVARHGVTQVNMIAAVGNILLKRDRAEFPGNPTLRKVSAAPVSAQVADALLREFGITHVVESYGMTEAPGIAQVEFDDTSHRACLGRPIRHPLTGEPVSEVRIVDAQRVELPRGATGRIMVRSTTMMKGYFARPDLSRAVDPDGWFLTEDLGTMDADGFCWFRGRTAEMIRTRGENVAASDVEAVLLQHPAVSDAACVGVPSELGEEDIVAVVTLRPGAGMDPDGFAAFCAGRLAPHKRPRWLVVGAELPKTATQKVARHRLRDDPELMARARPC